MYTSDQLKTLHGQANWKLVDEIFNRIFYDGNGIHGMPFWKRYKLIEKPNQRQLAIVYVAFHLVC